MRVRVWITIHLCSKELVDVSRMVRKISRKNTWRRRKRRGEEVRGEKKRFWCLVVSPPRHLDLHLQVDFEVRQQREEDGQRQLKNLGHRRDAVLGERHAQVLLDGVNEHLVRAEDGPGALQHRQQQLQRHNLGAQLVRPAERSGRDTLRLDLPGKTLNRQKRRSFLGSTISGDSKPTTDINSFNTDWNKSFSLQME